MKFRTGVAVGAAGYLAGLWARMSLRRWRPGRRLRASLVAYYERRLERAVRRLTARAEQGGPLVKAALAGARALSEGKSPVRALLSVGWTALKETLAGIFGGGRKARVTTIVEQIDIGAPRRLVYDQWTRFQDFPTFMKKVVSVDQTADEKLSWKARIFWSGRRWEATIVDQVPDDHITWRAGGRIDGTVTFHALARDLTRVLLVIEYRPRGLFERTANLWRAQGRRVRLELKHFRRHVMTRSLVRPEEVAGWRGVIHDGEVVEAPKSERKRAIAR
ncbi:SRPBCC family protein [Spirillospora sp. NPDC029432]|uniref:SRPBCC family protein n=1 Tax=Spirillospora sp. NPDC029432 TaxID=3154599 RepID=UPI0034535846